MAPLVLNPSVQRWNVERAEGGWPVWNGETGIVAGDERARNDQDESRACGEDSKGVVRAIVRCGERLQWLAPWAV